MPSLHPALYIALVLAAMTLTKVVHTPILLQMVLYSVPIITTGSYLSLIFRTSGASDDQGEILSREDSMKAPFHASFMILCLYLAFQIIPPDLVNLAISTLISVVGFYSVTQTASLAIYYAMGQRFNRGPKFSLKWPRLDLHFSLANVIGAFVALFIIGGWFITHWWILHNLFAICICIQFIRHVSLGTFKVGAMLLVGLFVYDIFWVFGTGVMVKVATSVDAPAKLLFPMGGLNSTKHSLLGLGDIVIPGVFMAMTLRLDYWIYHHKKGKPEDVKVPHNVNWKFPKIYFKASLISYALGLLATGLVLIAYGAAQPALLYLVPALLVGLYGPAIVRKELHLVNEFEESGKEEEQEEEEEEEEEDEESDSGGAEQ